MGNITFNVEEANVIAASLVDQNIDFPTSCLLTCTFPIELLRQIKKVKLINTRLTDLEFLTFLPNLEELVISNLEYQKVAEYLDYSDSAFNIIEDFSAISKLRNLKKLIIDNDVCVKELDLGKLSNLECLILTNNPGLRSLKGMGDLHKLKSVLMYGNSIREFEGIDDYLINTIDTAYNTIDLDAFFTYVKGPEDLNKLYDLYVRGLTHIRFSEKNGQVGHVDMEIPTVVELYKKVYTMFKRAKMFDSNFTNEDKIDYIYKYVTSNVKFAEDELQKREKLYRDEVKPRFGRIPDFYDRHFGAVHGSYYAYYFKNANCEGMVNLMKFMSNVLGIESDDVHCSDKKSGSTSLNHAIYRTKYNGVYCYYDPAYRVNTKGKNKKDSIGNFGRLSYDDVSSYLNLCRYEKDMAYKSYTDKLTKILDDPDSDLSVLQDFLSWLYNENIYNVPIDVLIDSNFDNDFGKMILKKKERLI